VHDHDASTNAPRTLRMRDRQQLMGIRAEIGMPLFFYRVVIVELAVWSARAGRQDKVRGSDHVGEPK